MSPPVNLGLSQIIWSAIDEIITLALGMWLIVDLLRFITKSGNP